MAFDPYVGDPSVKAANAAEKRRVKYLIKKADSGDMASQFLVGNRQSARKRIITQSGCAWAGGGWLVRGGSEQPQSKTSDGGFATQGDRESPHQV